MLAEGPTESAERSRHICQLCAQLLGVTGAGISLVTAAGNRGVVCATDEVSARIEDLQFTLGEGACVEAVQGGVPVMVNDLHEPGEVAVEHWPAFMEGAAAAGVRAVFALPLRIEGISVGALDLFLEEDLDYARRLTRAGVPVELHLYPGAFHGFDMAPQIARVAKAASRDSHDALRRALHD